MVQVTFHEDLVSLHTLDLIGMKYRLQAYFREALQPALFPTAGGYSQLLRINLYIRRLTEPGQRGQQTDQKTITG